jgi:heme exporter protein A
MPRLIGRGLACIRGGREVFSGLDFAAESGRALVLTGRNGAGKTTLLRMIAGLLESAAGDIAIEGGEAEASVAEQAHYLGHRDALKPALTVTENLHFWGEFLGERPVAIDGALDAVGLAGLAHLPAGYLSAGQRRRLSIARLVAVRRPLWLLDEPTAALDSASQDRLTELMQAHLASGGLIVAATHGPLGLRDLDELRMGAAS